MEEQACATHHPFWCTERAFLPSATAGKRAGLCFMKWSFLSAGCQQRKWKAIRKPGVSVAVSFSSVVSVRLLAGYVGAAETWGAGFTSVTCTGGGLLSSAVKAFPCWPVDVVTVSREAGLASTSSPFSLCVKRESRWLLNSSPPPHSGETSAVTC